uniref:Secreted protein n=1 Tax=Pararge aegeria TaxID=116150 RepID=S4PYD8_9NEOP
MRCRSCVVAWRSAVFSLLAAGGAAAGARLLRVCCASVKKKRLVLVFCERIATRAAYYIQSDNMYTLYFHIK